MRLGRSGKRRGWQSETWTWLSWPSRLQSRLTCSLVSLSREQVGSSSVEARKKCSAEFASVVVTYSALPTSITVEQWSRTSSTELVLPFFPRFKFKFLTYWAVHLCYVLREQLKIKMAVLNEHLWSSDSPVTSLPKILETRRTSLDIFGEIIVVA